MFTPDLRDSLSCKSALIVSDELMQDWSMACCGNMHSRGAVVSEEEDEEVEVEGIDEMGAMVAKKLIVAVPVTAVTATALSGRTVTWQGGCWLMSFDREWDDDQASFMA